MVSVPSKGVDGFEVGHVPDDVVVEEDAVAAEHVTRVGDQAACLARVVHLGQARDGGTTIAGEVQGDQYLRRTSLTTFGPAFISGSGEIKLVARSPGGDLST